jgi:hypothetical protein
MGIGPGNKEGKEALPNPNPAASFEHQNGSGVLHYSGEK